MFRDNLEAVDKPDDFSREDEEIYITTTVPSFRDTDEVITLQDMRKALRAVLGDKGVGHDETDKLADYLMNFFGFEDYIIDNVLDSEDRDVFYTLEEEGLLRTESEEIYLLKGKMWRIHYWILRKRDILKLSREKTAVKEGSPDTCATVYEQMGDDLWHSRADRDEP